jgi:hypothetical protein
MATFYSDLMTGDTPLVHRANKQGNALEVTAVVKFKAGTVLGASDVIKFLRLGENTKVDSLELQVSADFDPSGTAIEGTLGTVRANDRDGNAIVVDNKTGTSYTSGAGDADAFVAALATPLGTAGTYRYVSGQSGLDNEFAADPGFLATPQDVAITMSGAGTDLAADSYLRLTLRLRTKEATQGEFVGALATAYRNRYDTAGSSNGLKS